MRIDVAGLIKVHPGPPQVTALRGVDLSLAGGSNVAIVGRSGSGKSTLLHLLGLLDTPTEGLVRFDGADVASLDDDARSEVRGRSVGFIFQSFHLLDHLTVSENVALAARYAGTMHTSAVVARAAECLESVALTHRQSALAAHLSGGERQRVAIARALFNDPPLILADEPTGNLDRDSGELVLAALAGAADGSRSVVTVTHDAEVAARADRQIRMSDGLVVDDSHPEPARAR